MKVGLRTFGLIALGTTVRIVMLGLAAILMIPLVIAAISVFFVKQGPMRAAPSATARRDVGKDVLEGEWVVLDVQQKKTDGGRQTH